MLGGLAGRKGMTGPRAPVLGDCAARHLICPGAEPLFVSQVAKAALHSKEDVLHDIVDRRGVGHAPRHERPKARLEVAIGAAHVRADHAVASGVQQDGPQHALSASGLRASIAAEAT